MTKQLRVLRERLSVLRDRFRRGDVPGISGDIVTPWWVDVITNWGRPVVAAAVLTMCAPGEHYLARVAGFPKVHPPLGFTVDLAWGMPFVLTAYAGISAVVATKRPKGAPGHATAVLGAVVAIGLAMAAQPISHLWGVKGLDLQHILLICVVSSVPSAVFGHLLHMGASAPKVRRTVKPKADKRPDKRVTRPDTAPDRPLTDSPDSSVDTATWTPDTAPDTVTLAATDTPRTPDIGQGSLSADVRQYLTDHPDASNDDLYTAMRLSWPDKPDNSFYIARKRFERKIGKVS